MDREIKGQLGIFGVHDKIHFERIAVVDGQEEEYGLSPNFEGEPGYEIDALNAYDSEREILLGHVNPHFDEDIHKQVLEKYSEKYINDMISGKVQFLREDGTDN